MKKDARADIEQELLQKKFGIFSGKYLLNFRTVFLKLKDSGKKGYFAQAAKKLFDTTDQRTYRKFEEFFSGLSKAYWEMRNAIDEEQAKIEYDEMMNIKDAYARSKASPHAA